MATDRLEDDRPPHGRDARVGREPMHRRLPRWLEIGVQIAAALVVTALVLGAIELGCALTFTPPTIAERRAAGWPPPMIGGDSVATAVRFAGANAIPMTQDADLLWRNRADAEKTNPVNPRRYRHHDTWTVRTDRNGYRGPDRPATDERHDVFRVLCVGDSITFGFNVDQDATFERRLELALGTRFPGRPIEVINAGVPGWSWVQGRRFVDLEGLRLRPNAIVIGHGTNDQFWKSRITDSEHIWMLEHPLLRFLYELNGWALRTNTYRTILKHMPPPQEGHLSPGCETQIAEIGMCHRVSLAEIELSIHALHEVAAAANVDLLVVNTDFLETQAVTAVRRAVQKDHLPFLDLVRYFDTLRLGVQLRRSNLLGLAPPRVPSVRLGPPLSRPPHMVFRVVMPDGGPVSIHAGTYPESGVEVQAPMFDDGTHGDEIADDGVFSVTLDALGDRPLAYQFYGRDDVPEFDPVPPYPSSWARRTMRFADDGIAPIEVFGERYLMAEGVHPDADGHAAIATAVLQALETLPSYRGAFGDTTKESDGNR